MRPWTVLPLLIVLASCASTVAPDGRIEILTRAQSQPLSGAQCEVDTGAGKWTVSTPGWVQIGQPQGDLRVVCNKDGYRSSEVVFRRGSTGAVPGATRVGVGMGGGFGGYSGVGISLGFGFPLSSGRTSYPSQVVVDMTPQ